MEGGCREGGGEGGYRGRYQKSTSGFIPFLGELARILASEADGCFSSCKTEGFFWCESEEGAYWGAAKGSLALRAWNLYMFQVGSRTTGFL